MHQAQQQLEHLSAPAVAAPPAAVTGAAAPAPVAFEQPAQAKQAETAAYFVLQTANPEVGIEEEDEEEDDVAAGDHPEPVVIAEMERPIRTLTVSMAAAELDLTDSPTIVFRNAAYCPSEISYFMQ